MYNLHSFLYNSCGGSGGGGGGYIQLQTVHRDLPRVIQLLMCYKLSAETYRGLCNYRCVSRVKLPSGLRGFFV